MTIDESNKVRELYELYEQPMYRIAYAVLKDSGYAEDSVSEAFMRIIRKIKKIGDPRSEKSKRYIIKIIKNIAIDQYRKNKILYERTQHIEEENLLIPDESADVECSVLDDEPLEILDDLNEADKQIVILRIYSELSWKEVSEKLSMTEACVRKRFERLRKSLLMKGEIYNAKK